MNTPVGREPLLYLSDGDIRELDISIPLLMERIEHVLALHGEGTVVMPPKEGFGLGRNASLRAMPAYIPELGSGGLKWIGSFPSNRERGLPRTTGVIVLNDTETVYPATDMTLTYELVDHPSTNRKLVSPYLPPSKDV